MKGCCCLTDMASELDHIALANRNHATLLLLLENANDHLEWLATVAFYKAVQVVEAAFACDGIHSNSHRFRERRLQNLPKYGPIYKNYSHLEGASRVARYLQSSGGRGYSSFSDFMDVDDVTNRLIYKRLHCVEQQVLSHLSDGGKRALDRVTVPARD